MGQTWSTWSEAWEPSTGDGLGMIVHDPAVLNDPTRQRIIMRFPAAGGSVPHAAGGMYALHYPARPLSLGAEPMVPAPPV